MSEPQVTEADREKVTTPADWKTAVEVRPHYAPCDFPDNPCSCGAAEDRYAIAAALAAEREAVLAEAQSGLLAHRDPGVRRGDGDHFGKGWNSALNFAADWIGRRLRTAAAPSPATTTSEGNNP